MCTTSRGRAEDPAAPRAYLEAARYQAAEYRYDLALRLVERGLVLGETAAEQFALTCYRGEILHDLGAIDEARSAYEQAFVLAGDETERCRARLGLAAVKRITDDLDGAFADLQQAEAAAERLKLIEEAARAHFLHGNLLFPCGDMNGCLREHQRSLELARRAGSAELEAAALGGLGDAEYMRGRMLSAHDRFRRCVELCQRHGFGRIAVANRPMVANTLWYVGDLAGMLREALAAIDAAAKVGHRRAEPIAHANAYVARLWGMDLDVAPARRGARRRARAPEERSRAVRVSDRRYCDRGSFGKRRCRSEIAYQRISLSGGSGISTPCCGGRAERHVDPTAA